MAPDCAMDALDIAQYDSLLLPGASDIREAIENEAVLSFIRRFDGLVIGAISIAPETSSPPFHTLLRLNP